MSFRHLLSSAQGWECVHAGIAKLKLTDQMLRTKQGTELSKAHTIRGHCW